MKRLAVFCGSRFGDQEAYRDAARSLGNLLVERGITLVYGGGDVGLMGTIADTVMGRGGEVVGVIPQSLVDREVAHHGITELHVVDGMHDRKALIYHLSDAALALPGGIGTFEELFEALTWNQLGIHAMPCGLLNVGGYYDPLAAMIRSATEHGFIEAPERFLLVESDADRLLDRLAERL
jgi:uncharacterized protein (TIGR00730 family)